MVHAALLLLMVDDTGKITREVKVASDPDALLAVLTDPAYHFKRIGLEAGQLSQWLFSALAEADLPVTVRHRGSYGPIVLKKSAVATHEVR
jgi:hypothetical protein